MVNPILKKAIMPSEEEPVDISMQLPLSCTEGLPLSCLYSFDPTSLLMSTHAGNGGEGEDGGCDGAMENEGLGK